MLQERAYIKRRTKIVATLGPAMDNPEVFSRCIDAGLNVARFNFSHGNHEDHLQRYHLLKETTASRNRIVGTIADLQGPKIRIAGFKDDKVELTEGQTFTFDLSLADDAGDTTQVGLQYRELINDVTVGDVLLLDDGRMRMSIQEIGSHQIICRVENSGALSNNKGINLLGGGISAKALTDKDRKDLEFAVKHNFTYIALSFVCNADDIHEAKQLIAKHGGKQGVIAKIERAEALTHIDEIIMASDGVMVARGDLAVEIGDARVPVVQKEIIHKARAMDKPVITATQMMESMVHSVVPTRAEVSDVANAVLDNTDAVMLSEETAMGDHPDVVIEAMARACMGAGQSVKTQVSGHRVECSFDRIDEAIAMATMYTANHCNIQAILALTESGMTPLWMSRIRTAIPVYALSRNARTLEKMTLYRGVYPIPFDVTQFTREQINAAAMDCLELHANLDKGDQVILTKGDHLGVGGGANAMKILVVGQVL